METNLSKAIDITNDTARYDESVKELLADKQVLARILKRRRICRTEPG